MIVVEAKVNYLIIIVYTRINVYVRSISLITNKFERPQSHCHTQTSRNVHGNQKFTIESYDCRSYLQNILSIFFIT